MTTNVAPEDLNYHQYEQEVYDRDIINSIPGHEELHQHIREILKQYAGKAPKILELGVGTGLTASAVLTIVPDAEFEAMDFSDTMLAGAKRRLHLQSVTYTLGDYSQLPFGKRDIIISVIGIHHQTHEGRKALFRKIHEALNPNGIFVFGDLMTYRDPKDAAYNEARHFAHLVEKSYDDKSLREWAHHHKFLNILAPMEDQMDWLMDAGFTDVAIVYQKHNTVLLSARR